jgi:hypothetical protein
MQKAETCVNLVKEYPCYSVGQLGHKTNFFHLKIGKNISKITICMFNQSTPQQFYHRYMFRSLLDHLQVMFIYQNYKKLHLHCVHNMPVTVKVD